MIPITNVQIVEKIFEANDQLALQNLEVIDQAGVYPINLVVSPGAGKTSEILEIIRRLKSKMHIGVIAWDTALVTINADKVIAAGMPADPNRYRRRLSPGCEYVAWWVG